MNFRFGHFRTSQFGFPPLPTRESCQLPPLCVCPTTQTSESLALVLPCPGYGANRVFRAIRSAAPANENEAWIRTEPGFLVAKLSCWRSSSSPACRQSGQTSGLLLHRLKTARRFAIAVATVNRARPLAPKCANCPSTKAAGGPRTAKPSRLSRFIRLHRPHLTLLPRRTIGYSPRACGKDASSNPPMRGPRPPRRRQN
jgi:hypothetical protein